METLATPFDNYPVNLSEENEMELASSTQHIPLNDCEHSVVKESNNTLFTRSDNVYAFATSNSDDALHDNCNYEVTIPTKPELAEFSHNLTTHSDKDFQINFQKLPRQVNLLHRNDQNSKLENANKVISELQLSNNELSSQLASLKVSLTKEQDEGRLNKQKFEYKISEVTQEQSACLTELSSCRKDLISYKQQLAELSSEFEYYRALSQRTKNETSRERFQLESQVMTLEERSRSLEQSCSHLELSRDALNEEVTALREEVRQSRERESKLRNELQSMRRQLQFISVLGLQNQPQPEPMQNENNSSLNPLQQSIKQSPNHYLQSQSGLSNFHRLSTCTSSPHRWINGQTGMPAGTNAIQVAPSDSKIIADAQYFSAGDDQQHNTYKVSCDENSILEPYSSPLSTSRPRLSGLQQATQSLSQRQLHPKPSEANSTDIALASAIATTEGVARWSERNEGQRERSPEFTTTISSFPRPPTNDTRANARLGSNVLSTNHVRHTGTFEAPELITILAYF